MSQFYERIQLLCQERKTTLSATVKELGLSTSMVTRWKLGYTPTQKTLLKLAFHFNVTTDYLLGYDVDPKNITPVEGIISFEEIGSVKAGFGGTAEEIPTGKKIDLPASMLGGREKSDYFVLRVSGDSMYPTLIDGDNILCERCTSVDSGAIAVVLYNSDEATVKKVRYTYGEDWLELVPINPMYPTKRIEGEDLENCRVLGRVVKLIRNF